MKKVFAIIVVIGIIGSANAKSLKGSLGMGIGWMAPRYEEITNSFGPDFIITKFGISEKLVFEPLIGFDFVSISNGASETGSLIQLRGIMGFLFREHKKTNVYLKGGIGFMVESPLYDEPYSSAFGIEIPFGFGLEHFISDYFSINFDAFSGFSFLSANEPDVTVTSFSLGNHHFLLSLMWYY